MMVIEKLNEMKHNDFDTIYLFKQKDYVFAINQDAEILKDHLHGEMIAINSHNKLLLLSADKLDENTNHLSQQAVTYKIIELDGEKKDGDIETIHNTNDNAKSKLAKIKFNIRYLAFVVGLVAIAVLIYFFTPLKTYVILTPSMEPTISVNDFVFINRYYAIDKIKEGDIIAFNVDFNNSGTKDVVVHYVFSIDSNVDNTYTIKTIAEGVTDEDPWTIDQDDYLGKYIGHIANVGRLVRFMQSPIGIAVLFIDIILVYYIIYHFKFEIKQRNRK